MIQLNEIATSVCRNCRFYEPQGRQGGNCQQFQVIVDGNWSTCKLALPAFSPAWQSLKDLPVQEQAAEVTNVPVVSEQVADPTAV